MSPLRTLRQIVAPAGRHRGPRAGHAERIEVPLDDLLGTPWPQPRPHNPVYAQCWDDCPHCGKATAGVLHATGWTCGECLTDTTSEGDGR